MRRTTREEYERRVLRAQRHVEANLDDEVAPAALAKIAGMSLHHFHRVFRGVSGESVMQFIRRLRLERAARQLRVSRAPVLRIAIEAGYGTHESFTRAFTESFGVPPSEYRAREVELAYRRDTCWLAPPADVVVRDEPERSVVGLRHTGAYRGVAEVWDRVWAWFQDQPPRLTAASPPQMFGLVPDDPQVTDTESLRYDACLSLGRVLSPHEIADTELMITTIPAGRYAITTHRGPYDRLADAYLALIGGWFPSSGYTLAAEPVIEHYLNSPTQSAPDELVTEIWVRIEARGWMT